MSSPAPPPDSSQKKKKKKRRSGGLEEPLPPPHTSPQTPHPPPQKKKKRRSEVLEESATPPSEASPQKKKKSEILEESATPSPSEASPQKKKKKKKRRSEVLEEPATPPPPPSSPEVSPQKKKKKRWSEILKEKEEVSVSSSLMEPPAPPPETSSSLEKKSRRSEVPEEPPSSPLSPRSSVQKKKRSEGEESRMEEVRVSPPAPGGAERESGGRAEGGEKEVKEEEVEKERSWKDIITEQLDSALLEELEEFVPDLKKKSTDQIRKLIQYDLHRFKVFKQQGLSLRKGRFSQQENQQISANVGDFLALTSIPSATQLLFPHRFKGQEAEIRKLKAQHRFLETIAEGIPRTCEQVYTRAKKIFDDGNHMGRFSEEEINCLKKLQKLHGNDWKTISQKMDRSVYALQKRFISLSSSRGFWEPDEESRLKQAIKTHLETLVQENPCSGLSRHQLCNNLPWKQISDQVQTRSWSQCRLKWFSILNPRLSPGRRVFDRGSKGLGTKIHLINTLYQMSVDDLADVDWNEVADSIGNVTPNSVQKNFHRLKVLKVPHWNRLSFGEIVDFLHHSVLPELQDRQREHEEGAGPQEDEEAGLQDGHQQLSDIFSTCDDDDDSS